MINLGELNSITDQKYYRTLKLNNNLIQNPIEISELMNHN